MRRKKIQYRHNISGDMIKVEIRDLTYRVEYRKKFNIRDTNCWLEVLEVAGSYGLNVAKLIEIMLKKRGIDIAPHI